MLSALLNSSSAEHSALSSLCNVFFVSASILAQCRNKEQDLNFFDLMKLFKNIFFDLFYFSEI